MGVMRMVAVALGVAGLLVGTVSGQFRGNWRDIGEPDISKDQLTRYADMLELDEMQREFAEDLLLSYMAEVTRLGERYNEVRDGARDEFRQTRDNTVWRDFMEVSTKFREEKDEISERLFDDLSIILTEKQASNWERVEQRYRRETTLDRGGLVPGEGVDVVKLVEESEFSENPEVMGSIEPVLEQYSRDLDRKLKARNEVYEKGMREGTAAWFDQDMEKMGEMFENSRTIAKEVREINRRYARSVASVLPEDDRTEFEMEFKRESFPQIYRDTPAHRAFETAMQIEDLTPEQKTELEELNARFSDRMLRINDSLAEAVEDWEDNRPVTAVFGFRGGRDDGPDELRSQRQARQEFINRMVEQVRGTLTPEQATVLPEPAKRDWRNVDLDD